MTDFMTVVEVNPVVFVNKIIAEIRNGYYVTNTMEGYPIMGMPNYISLFETDEPAIIHPMPDEIQTLGVSGYDIMRWLLDVQDAIIQGFVPSDTPAFVDNYKTITLVRATVASLEGLKPAESATEAPVAKTKRPTKPKTIKE